MDTLLVSEAPEVWK